MPAGVAGAIGLRVATRYPLTAPDAGGLEGFEARAHDDGHSLVAGPVTFWRAGDGTLHASAAEVEAAGQQVAGTEDLTTLQFVGEPIPVLRPEDGIPARARVFGQLRSLHRRLARVRPGGTRIEQLFPRVAPDLNMYEPHEPYRYFVNADDVTAGEAVPDRRAGFDVRYTVGVRAGDLNAFLSRVRERRWWGGPAGAGEHLADALRFGAEAGGWFAGSSLAGLGGRRVPGFAVGMLAADAGVTAVRGYLALVYVQVAALLQRGVAGRGVIADFLSSLTPPAAIRAALAGPVQGFLEGNAEEISRLALEYFLRRTGTEADPGRVREYLADALSPGPADHLIDQHQALGVMAAAGGVAADAGAGRVVQLELAAHGVGLAAAVANHYVLEAAGAAGRGGAGGHRRPG